MKEVAFVSDSYDLIVKLAPWNEQMGTAWGWVGSPMRELAPVQKRARREVKQYGSRILAYKIVLMRLNVKTGQVEQSIVEEWMAAQQLAEVPA